MPRTFQYQGRAEPITTAFKERSTPDKYLPITSDPPQSGLPLRKIAAAAVLLGALTACAFVQPVPAKERATPDKWAPAIQQPQFDQARKQHLHLVHAEPTHKLWVEIVSADRFVPLSNQPQFDVTRSQYLHPSSSFYPFPLAGGAPSTVIAPPATPPPIVLVWKRGTPASRSVEPHLPAIEKISLDRWHPPIEQPLFSLPQKQYSAPCYGSDDGAVAGKRLKIANADWAAPIVQPQFQRARNQYLYPAFLSDGGVAAVKARSVFADSWFPGVQPPQFDRQRKQYLHPAYFAPLPVSSIPGTQGLEFGTDDFGDGGLFGTPGDTSNSWAESVSIDRWHPLLEQPQFERPQRQYSAPSSAVSGSIGIVAPITADKWAPLPNQPQFAAPSRGYLIPEQDVSPIATVFLERSAQPDKWGYPVEQPRFDVPRTQYLAPVFAGPTSNVFAELVQGKSFSAQPIDQPVFDVARSRQQYLYPAVGVEPVSPVFIELFSGDRWSSSIVQPLFDVPRRQYIYPDQSPGPIAPLFVERSTPDKYAPLDNQPQFDLPRRQQIYPEVSEGPVAPFYGELISVDRWVPLDNQPVFDLPHRQQVYPDESAGPVGIVFTAVLPVEGWASAIEQPQFDLGRRQQLYQVSAEPVSPALAELVSPDRFAPLDNQPLFDLPRRQTLYPELSAEPVSTLLAELVTADEWVPLDNQPLFDQDRRQYLYPTQFELQPASSIYGTQALEFGGVGFGDGLFGTPGATTNSWAERTTPDKYLPLDNQPLFDLPRRQTLYPELSAGPVPATLTELNSADRWIPLDNQPLFDLPRRQNLYPERGVAPVSPLINESVSPDRWGYAIEEPLFAQARKQYFYPASFAPESLPFVRILADRWFPGIQQPQFHAPRKQYLAEACPFEFGVVIPRAAPGSAPPLVLVWRYTAPAAKSFEPVFVPALIPARPDSWHPPIERPRFDAVRVQYLHPAYTVPASPPSVGADRRDGEPVYELIRRVESRAYITTGEPVFTANLASKTVLADSYLPDVERPRYDLARAQYLYQVVAPGTERPPSVQTSRQAGEPAFELVRRVDSRVYVTTGEPVFTAAVAARAILADSHYAGIERPRFEAKRHQALYEPLAYAPLPVPKPVIGWFQPLSEPTRRTDNRAYLLDNGEIFSQAPGFGGTWDQAIAMWGDVGETWNNAQWGERTQLDKFGPLDNQPVFDVKRLQALYPSLAFNPLPIPARIFPDRYFPGIEQPRFDVGRRQHLYTSATAADRQQLAKLDSWVIAIVQPQFDSKKQQHLYPVQVAPVANVFPEVASTDRFAPAPNQPLFDQARRQNLYPAESAGPSNITHAEIILGDKWLPLPNQPLFDARRLQQLYPQESASSVAPAVPELVSSDRFLPFDNQPQFDLQRRQNLYPDSSVAPISPAAADLIELVSIDRFHPAIEQPLFDLQRSQYLHPAHSGPVSNGFVASGPTGPADRVTQVLAENRFVVVAPENRFVQVGTENRFTFVRKQNTNG